MTEEEKKAAEAIALATAQEEAEKKRKEAEAAVNVETPDQIRVRELEAEKAVILEREANYRAAYLKEADKNKNRIPADETDEERVRRITREEIANRDVARIDVEKEALLKKALKENSELKLAMQNKPPATSTGGGGSTEQPGVVSTLVTPEQLAAFKARGWTDKDIENYKANLRKRL